MPAHGETVFGGLWVDCGHMRGYSVPLGIGCALAFLPWLTSDLPEQGIGGMLKFGIECLMLPGGIVGMIIYQNIHGINNYVVDAVDILFYSGLAYAFLGARARRKGTR